MRTAPELADHLLRAHARRERFATLEADGRRLSLDEGYAVQDLYVEAMRRAAGDAIAGYKIGLTSPVMQQMCGIATPVQGRILASRVHAGGCTLALSSYGRLGLEFELAVRVARDIESVPPDWQQLAPSLDAIAPAIELVDDRAADYDGLDAASLVADNAWNAGIVLGDWSAPPADLAERSGRVRIDGAEADSGRVGDALEHPFASVHWLAAHLAGRGRTLERGMVVMTGSIVRTRFPTSPGRWRYEVDGLAPVEVEIVENSAP